MSRPTAPFAVHATAHTAPSRSYLEDENARLRAEIKRLRAGEEPAEPHQPLTTGGQFLWVLGSSSPDVRLRLADSALRALDESARCVMGDHEALIRFLRARNARLEGVVDAMREETRRLAQISDGTGRGVALALAFLLAQSNSQIVL